MVLSQKHRFFSFLVIKLNLSEHISFRSCYFKKIMNSNQMVTWNVCDCHVILWNPYGPSIGTCLRHFKQYQKRIDFTVMLRARIFRKQKKKQIENILAEPYKIDIMFHSLLLCSREPTTKNVILFAKMNFISFCFVCIYEINLESN